MTKYEKINRFKKIKNYERKNDSPKKEEVRLPDTETEKWRIRIRSICKIVQQLEKKGKSLDEIFEIIGQSEYFGTSFLLYLDVYAKKKEYTNQRSGKHGEGIKIPFDNRNISATMTRREAFEDLYKRELERMQKDDMEKDD